MIPTSLPGTFNEATDGPFKKPVREGCQWAGESRIFGIFTALLQIPGVW